MVFPTVGINVVLLGTTVYILTSRQTLNRKKLYFLSIVFVRLNMNFYIFKIIVHVLFMPIIFKILTYLIKNKMFIFLAY